MNARQLLLGLSILVPAVCGAKPHGPFANLEEISVPLTLCEVSKLRAMVISGDEHRDLSGADETCYKLNYRLGDALLFVWVDTLYGTYFGFAIPKDLRYYKNELPEVIKDLRKQVDQYPGLLRIGPFWGFRKQPEKLNW